MDKLLMLMYLLIRLSFVGSLPLRHVSIETPLAFEIEHGILVGLGLDLSDGVLGVILFEELEVQLGGLDLLFSAVSHFQLVQSHDDTDQSALGVDHFGVYFENAAHLHWPAEEHVVYVVDLRPSPVQETDCAEPAEFEGLSHQVPSEHVAMHVPVLEVHDQVLFDLSLTDARVVDVVFVLGHHEQFVQLDTLVGRRRLAEDREVPLFLPLALVQGA